MRVFQSSLQPIDRGGRVLHKAKSLAPEPHFSACMALVYEVAIYVRALTYNPERLTAEEIREINQLMDAIHNIPESLIHYDPSYSEAMIGRALRSFDERAADEKRLKLTPTFEKLLAKVRALS